MSPVRRNTRKWVEPRSFRLAAMNKNYIDTSASNVTVVIDAASAKMLAAAGNLLVLFCAALLGIERVPRLTHKVKFLLGHRNELYSALFRRETTNLSGSAARCGVGAAAVLV